MPTVQDTRQRQLEERRRAAEHAALEILLKAATLEAAAAGVLAVLARACQCEWASLWMMDGQVLRCFCIWHEPSLVAPEFEAVTRGYIYEPDCGVIGRTWTAALPMHVEDFATNSDFLRRSEAMRAGLHAVTAVPVQWGGSVLGVMEFLDRKPHPLDPQALEMLTIIADQVGQFIERKRGEEAMRQAERFQAGQNRVLELLATGHDLKEVLTALIETVEEQVPGLIGSVLLLDEEGQHLMDGAAPHLPEDYSRAIHGLKIGPRAGSCGTAAYRNAPVIVEDILSDPLWADYQAQAKLCGQRACWSQPIHASDGRVLGTFAMYFGERRRPTAGEVQLIESAAHLAGVAIERQQKDLALKRAKEAAEAANRAKDQFLAILPHELRTPLTPVLAKLKLMQHHPGLPADMCAELESMRRNVKLEARIIDDLLDLTKIAKGQMQLSFETVDAHQELRMAAEIFQAEILAKPLRLIVDLRAENHWVRADPARLQQVFWNLISNAVKYTPPHGTITLRSTNRPGGVLRVQVSDTGIGLSPEVMPRLFGAFEQGEQTLTRHFAGLGLGLSISRKLVEMHGGTITAESAGKDQGATFTVELRTERVGAG